MMQRQWHTSLSKFRSSRSWDTKYWHFQNLKRQATLILIVTSGSQIRFSLDNLEVLCLQLSDWLNEKEWHLPCLAPCAPLIKDCTRCHHNCSVQAGGASSTTSGLIPLFLQRFFANKNDPELLDSDDWNLEATAEIRMLNLRLIQNQHFIKMGRPVNALWIPFERS